MVCPRVQVAIMSAGYVVDDTALGFAVTDMDGNYAVLVHTVEGM
jgi:hypothetical protein